MPIPYSPGKQVAEFLGQGENPELVAMADEHIHIVKAMVQAYTRGKGFHSGMPEYPIEAVITTATARLLANPGQIKTRVGEVAIDGGFSGWTLAELFVLNNYRRRAG